VLHEVPDPSRVLAGIRLIAGPNTLIHVNVPNAGSLHRRLAQAMGLITSTKELSERNRALTQPRVYDLESITQEVRRAGFSPVETGGYFVKPFTHAQMEQIAQVTSDAMLEGLYRLGQEMPDIASEIYVQARVSP